MFYIKSNIVSRIEDEVTNYGKRMVVCPINACEREIAFGNMPLHSHIRGHIRRGDLPKETSIKDIMHNIFNCRG